VSNPALLARLLDRSTPGANGCREWTRGKDDSGYGAIWIDGLVIRAHVAMYVAVHGPFPNWMVVRHSCDNPGCIAIDHLVLGTHADNTRDKMERGRHFTGTRPRGIDVNTAKLTEQDVLAIRSDPRSSRAVGRDYGVSKTAILQIRKRRSWQWL
jgi:HNH endonuclease